MCRVQFSQYYMMLWAMLPSLWLCLTQPVCICMPSGALKQWQDILHKAIVCCSIPLHSLSGFCMCRSLATPGVLFPGSDPIQYTWFIWWHIFQLPSSDWAAASCGTCACSPGSTTGAHSLTGRRTKLWKNSRDIRLPGGRRGFVPALSPFLFSLPQGLYNCLKTHNKGRLNWGWSSLPAEGMLEALILQSARTAEAKSTESWTSLERLREGKRRNCGGEWTMWRMGLARERGRASWL